MSPSDLFNLFVNAGSILTDWHFYVGIIAGWSSRAGVAWWNDPFRGFEPDPVLAVYKNKRKTGVTACPKCASERKFSVMRTSDIGWDCPACGLWLSSKKDTNHPKHLELYF